MKKLKRLTPRARDLGVPFEGTPGKRNAITDVAGVTVGHVTIVRGNGRLVKGKGPVRTGVTAVLSRGSRFDPVFAGFHVLNGNGDMTGTHWIEESGYLEAPILMTNTFSLGEVRDAAAQWMDDHRYYNPLKGGFWFGYPVVAETYDGFLNDILGQHVTTEHVFKALDSASAGPVAEGNVGGGTGMIAFGFKGGIGTSSRIVRAHGRHTVGVLVQANHGSRHVLRIAGLPVGHLLRGGRPEFYKESSRRRGSVIVIIATDAPLLPHQLKRLAARASLGLGQSGAMGEDWSGDFILAFSTANPRAFKREGSSRVEMIANDDLTPLFEAVIQATEESVVNALVAAETMTGINGNTVHRLPHEKLAGILQGAPGRP
jgi:L-aminopeptidase/D-esterase-like protein